MTKFTSQNGLVWRFLAIAIALVVLAPIVVVIWLACTATGNIWPHLVATALSRYLGNTLVLISCVGFGAMILGSGLAYVVTHLQFPGRRWIQYLLFLPLAVPSFVAAFAWIDILEYAGPLQTGLRQWFGWENARSYWFPEVRSLTGAALVLILTLYPYVYLFARASFRALPAGGRDVAQSFGLGAWAMFWRVAWPQARPGIVAGTAIVMMETINDFGTVDFFAVQTLTTGIFSIWLENNDPNGAAQLALFALVLVGVLAFLEKTGRKRAKFHRTGRQVALITPSATTQARRMGLTVLCLIPLVFGFVVPVSYLTWPVLTQPQVWDDAALWGAAWNSLSLGLLTAFAVVVLAVTVVFGLRQAGGVSQRRLLPLTTLGYAIPGAILGLGVLLPLATFDNWMADIIFDWTGADPGLVLTGGISVLVLAFSVRFFAIGVGAVDAGLEAIPPSLGHAARALGQGQLGVLTHIFTPLIKGSLATAMVLVFVDTVKELPATLLLRPFNYETLSTHIYAQASLENFAGTGPGAIIIIGLSLIAVILLAKANR